MPEESKDPISTSSTPEAASEEFATPRPPAPPKPTKKESRVGRFFKRALRWAVGLLAVFALGVLVSYYFTYLPTRAQLTLQEADLQEAEQRVAELEAQVESLSALEPENQALKEELLSANLRMNFLTAIADVMAARLALLQDRPDTATARSHIVALKTSLSNLAELLGDEEQDALHMK